MATDFIGMLMNLFIQKMHRWKGMMVKKGNIFSGTIYMYNWYEIQNIYTCIDPTVTQLLWKYICSTLARRASLQFQKFQIIHYKCFLFLYCFKSIVKILSHYHKKRIYDAHFYSFYFTISNVSFLARLEGLQQQQTTMATNLTGILINLFIHKMGRCEEIMVTQVNIFRVQSLCRIHRFRGTTGLFPFVDALP